MNDDNRVIVVEAGTATAYGSAVEGGYTGTYEDFCRQQAQYAQNASAVEQAKTDAQTAKNQAQTAKDDAVTAKNTAVSAKDDAVSAKNTAVSAKDDAVSAKNTASTKAQEASASATSAGLSATSASQSAQNAEQSAQGVSGSLAQIQTNKEDIDTLKADLADVKNDTTEYTTVFESTEWINNSNSAVQSNGDGTYNVGTSDYGTTVFGVTEVLDAGEYYLFGIATDKGFTFISLSTNVNNAIDTNDTKAIKKITISERRAYYIGMKMASKPTSAFVATPILLKSVKKIDELRTDVDSLDSEISTLSDIEGKILDDINISDISAQTMMHTAGDASVTFNSTNGFEYQRVTAQNNIVGFKIPTLPKKEYTATFSISGLSDGSISVYVCPAYEFNTGRALASDVDITSDKVVNFSFTATTAESSLWFSIGYRTTSVTILNVDINDGIIRYKLPTIMDYKGREISVFNKIACVGDSITEGTFNYTSGGTNANVVNISKYSYPSILTKLTGVTTSNLGRGGRTSVEWYDLFKNEDLSGYDAVIIMLGINDGVYATPIADFTTAICNIIDKFKQENNGIRIFLATIIPAYTDYDSKFDAYNTEIRRIASEEYTDVVLVDINRYSGCKKDTSYAQGHLTAIGYCKLAEEFSILISYEMYKNPHAFRNIQFIGTEYTYE